MNRHILMWEMQSGRPNRVCRLILQRVTRLNVQAHELVIGLCQAYAEVLKAVGENAYEENLEPAETLTYLGKIHQAVWQEVLVHLCALSARQPPAAH